MRYLAIAILFCLAPLTAGADVIFTGSDLTIDFTGFTGAGFDTTAPAGGLDSDDWKVLGLSDGDGTFGGSHTTGDFARGTASGIVTTGGIYNFDTSAAGGSTTTLGVHPGGTDFTPGAMVLAVKNSTGAALSSVTISYTGYVLNDLDRSNSLDLQFATTDPTDTTATFFTDPSAGTDILSAATADAAPAWVSSSESVTITFGTAIADGGTFYLGWIGDDVSGSGSRDEFAIDDIKISTAAVPEPSSMALLASLAGLAALRRRKEEDAEDAA